MKRLNSSGFTLIEVLYSIAILGIINLALSSMLATTINSYRLSKKQFEATLLVQNYYERIKAISCVEPGETIIESGGFTIVIDIVELDEYKDCMYKIIIKIYDGDELIEEIEGFKVIDFEEDPIENSA